MNRTVSLDFVFAPDTAARVAQSLTETPSWLQSVNDFTLGSPTFEAQPDSVGGKYGYRTCSFTLRMVGTYTEIAPTMQAISRQLLAARNWLRVRWGGVSQPMFLRTYRTPQASAQWHQSGDYWDLPVTLVCDPGLYGPREDAVASLVVTNNPETGTRGMYVDVPAVKGDFETAPVVWFPSSSTAMDGAGVWVGSESAPPGGAYRAQAANGTMGTGTTVVADATYSGGNKTVTTFATGTLANRVTGLVITGGGTTVPAGDYRVFARLASSVASAVYPLRLTQGGIVQSTVTWTAPATANTAELVDLGLYQLPAGGFPAQFGLSSTVPSAASESISFAAGRTSATGDLSFDYLRFMPANKTLGNLTLVGSGTGSAVIDGVNRPGALYQVTTASPFTTGADFVSPTTPPKISGGLPVLYPGATTRLHLVLAGTGTAVAITATRTVSVSYWPQYVHMRPDLT